MELVARVAPATSAAAVRFPLAFGDGALTIGQTVHARVARVEGDTVQLRLGEQTVSVTSRVPLNVGQQISLTVEAGAAGKLLLRMVDDTFRTGRSTRPGGSGSGRGPASSPSLPASGQAGPAGGPAAPVAGAPPGDIRHLADAARAGSDAGAAIVPGSRMARAHPGLAGAPAGVVEGDALTALLFEAIDGTADRLAGTTRQGAADLSSRSAAPGLAAGSVVARAAMPTYGRLAQSVGGTDAFGLLMATPGQDVGQTLARAPLAPADLGRLLVDVGVHPDETNTVLVGEMLAQGVALNAADVRRLRREVRSAGGGLRDAPAAITLRRFGLPITPLSLAVARQLLAGQLDAPAVWGDLLAELQTTARGPEAWAQAGVLASELLADWRVPLEDGAEGVARWLRAAVDQTATPLEAKLARALAAAGAEHGQASTPGQDVRARLDLLAQALPGSGQAEHGPLGLALQRAQAAVHSEQILNGATGERAEPRFFAITLPAVVGQQPSTVELRVREREGQPGSRRSSLQPDVVQMKLSLPGLGDLGISLMVGQHSASCHFSTSSPFAEALLNASSSDLVGRLKQLGFAHTTVNAAHEAVEAAPQPLTAAPRVNHVDLQA